MNDCGSESGLQVQFPGCVVARSIAITWLTMPSICSMDYFFDEFHRLTTFSTNSSYRSRNFEFDWKRSCHCQLPASSLLPFALRVLAHNPLRLIVGPACDGEVPGWLPANLS
jgi:hypothetical protein